MKCGEGEDMVRFLGHPIEEASSTMYKRPTQSV